VREVLCGEIRATIADAGDLLSSTADRVFRGHRGGARHCLAAGGLVGLRRFVGIALDEYTPDHSTISRTRRLIDLDTHREVFAWVLGVLADRGLLKGQRIAIDATTLEANAAMRSIVRRDTGESYEGFLGGLAKASGIATPTREDLARLDRKRKKGASNKEWKSPADGDARIAKMKDGRTHWHRKGQSSFLLQEVTYNYGKP
jgi:transposase